MSSAASTAQRDAPGRCGPYVLQQSVASGSMGVVYRARHVDTEEEVALKTLHTGEPTMLESLRREVRALSQIRHPGVVRFLGHGVEAGFPWYAMELIDGGTLSDLLRATDVGKPNDRALKLLQRVCAPLAFLHGEGIVHRDLKPENIAVRRDADLPVIVDFGVIGRWSTKLAREALEVGGELIGTVSYMAPEQARGEYVDARADLYSLGCILYEAAAGRPPFIGHAGSIFMQHLESDPEPPSRYVADLDPRLDRLIMQLLAKEPRHRIGFAADVAAALQEIFGEEEAQQSSPARPYLYRPSFVGREAIRSDLTASLAEIKGGRGACMMLGGESGSGKTRLAMEITRAAATAGFQVITGECPAPESATPAARVGGSPLLPLRPLLRELADRCVRDGPATTAALLGRRAKMLAAYAPELRAVPGFDDQPDAVALPPAAERDRALSELAELLVLLSTTRPLLLVLDDLQWADDMTLALLESLGGGVLERAHLLILGAYRSEEITPGLAGVLASPHVVSLDLNRLEREDVGAMVASMLAVHPPPRQLVRMLRGESEGNPFFVAEYLRAAVDAGFLYRTARGWEVGTPYRTDDPLHASLPLPSSLSDLLGRRFADLGEAALAVLNAGAVLGRRFDIDLASEVLGASEEEVMDAVRELLRRQVFEEDALGDLRFAHDKLREVAYARIAPHAAAELHARAAAGIEARQTDSVDFAAHYAELAHHWEMAGATDRAVHYLALAGEHALAAGAYKDAHLMIARALRLDDEMGGRVGASRRAQWQRMLGVSSFGIGDLDSSISYSAAALAGLGERVPRSAAGWAGVAAIELGRALLPLRAGRAVDRDGRMYEVAQACGQLATSYFYNADVLPAVANLLRGLNRAQRAGDAGTMVESYARLGYVSGAIGIDPLARRMFRRAHAAAERADDPRGHGLALYLDAMYQEFLGRWDTCRALAEEATTVLDAIGDQAEAETARAIASHGYFFAGQFVAARRCGEAILRTADDRASKHHIGWGQYLIARCDVVLGDLDAAIARLQDAHLLLEPLPDAIDIVICEGWLARALLYSDRAGEAADVAARLGRRLSSGKRPAVGQCVDGYGGWADVALAMWEKDIHSPELSRVALLACGELRAFARIFRMARPAAARCTAHAAWLSRRHAPALRAWKRSLREARSLGMPYEAARSLADLAQVATDEDKRAQYAVESAELFREMGCRRPPEVHLRR